MRILLSIFKVLNDLLTRIIGFSFLEIVQDYPNSVHCPISVQSLGTILMDIRQLPRSYHNSLLWSVSAARYLSMSLAKLIVDQLYDLLEPTSQSLLVFDVYPDYAQSLKNITAFIIILCIFRSFHYFSYTDTYI